MKNLWLADWAFIIITLASIAIIVHLIGNSEWIAAGGTAFIYFLALVVWQEWRKA